MSNPFQLLEDLIAAPSPSGYEQPAQEVYRRYCADFADTVSTDVLGNAIATIEGAGKPVVMLAGHVDEIGFQISGIHRDGYLYFEPVGGHDAVIAVGQRVWVHTATQGAMAGVIGKRPIHVLTQEERDKKTQITDLMIDPGSQKGVSIADIVRIGDPVTYAAPFQKMTGDLAVSHAFDNKTGAYVIAETLRMIKEKGGLKATVHGVSTVQEEIGLRGATAAAHRLNPHVGIAVDVGHATDYPGADRKDTEKIRLGGGPILLRGANINPEVFNRLVLAAQAEGIAFQLEPAPRGTGTDANAMQLSRGGMATGVIGLPLRYMHTPCEVIALSDLANAARLMTRFILDLDENADFTPSLANLHPPTLPKPEPVEE